MKNPSLRLKGLVLFLLLTGHIAFAQGSWERIDVPTKQNLVSVSFVDSLYGWAAGDSGTIIHTTDGGHSWIIQDSRTTREIADVFFLNRKLGWASSYNYSTSPYGTVLLKTTDGGASWISVPYPTENIFITCILFLDSLNGWMGGKPHALVRTTDGGISWEQPAIDTSTLAFFPVLGIEFLNPGIGYACGGIFDVAGVIWRTTNGGQKWYAIDVSDAPADEVRGLHIFDTLHVMGAGGDPDYGYGVGMIRSSDGGMNWEYEDIGLQGIAYDLDFRTPLEAWAPLGPKNRLIFSRDAGKTWNQVQTPDSTSVYTMTFPDSLHGFAVGNAGAVLKYHPPLHPSVNPVSPQPSDGFALHQNFPNPFHGVTTIRFTLPQVQPENNLSGSHEPMPVQITIFDPFGKVLSMPVNKRFSPGNHEVIIDLSGFPPGIYFYSLQAEINRQHPLLRTTRKMVAF